MNILQRIRLLFLKDKAPYFALYKILGFYPRKISYYQEALLHKSSSVRTEKGRALNNERLEFLGDAILDAVVADIVYKHFGGKREGFLTNTRSKVVQRETLNHVAVEIGLDKLITYSTRSTSHNSYMCGNAFEALIGAIYLDRGYDYCMYFMEERILGHYINLDKMAYKEMNFKSKLMEWSQKNRIEMEFRLVDQTKDVGSPVFQSEVIIEQLIAGSGTGYSKKESQQLAAKQALHRLRKDHTFEADINESKRKRLEAEEAAAKEAEQAAEEAKLAEEEQARIQAEEAEIAAAIAAEEAEAKVEVEAKVELEADADVNPQANA
jgi:ribonuclease-3